jgi:hypothetical protein
MAEKRIGTNNSQKNIVAIMYKPFSVKAFGKALVFANFVVENFALFLQAI